MTQEDLKKFSKKIRSIEDPFGTGFPYLQKVVKDTTNKYRMSNIEIFHLFSSWKSGRN